MSAFRAVALSPRDVAKVAMLSLRSVAPCLTQNLHVQLDSDRLHAPSRWNVLGALIRVLQGLSSRSEDAGRNIVAGGQKLASIVAADEDGPAVVFAGHA